MFVVGYSELLQESASSSVFLMEKSQKILFELIKAGLWEQIVLLSEYGEIDFSDVYRLAEEQSVIGLVTAGLEHVTDIKIPKEVILQFVGSTLQIEQQSKDMNELVVKLIDKLRNEGVYALLLKGQELAQCYEKPLWRSSGDVDLFLSDDNYNKAKAFLQPLTAQRNCLHT